MRKWIYRMIQSTWGIFQTMIGLVLFLMNRKEHHFEYHNSIVTEWNGGCISLGLFIFIQKKLRRNESLYRKLVVHEYGHTIQSLILGPFYLIMIGIPSFLWSRIPLFEKKRVKNQISYYSFYTEKWANALAERVTKERTIR